jgi:hypothetical protein
MQKASILFQLTGVMLLVAALQGCRKENGIDNNNVIKRPYGVYVGDAEGALYNTSNGRDYKLVFPPDGYAPRAVLTAGSNLLWIKENVHLSVNGGSHFNPVDFTVLDSISWQSIILKVPSHGRVYLCTDDLSGLKWSEDDGKTWNPDTKWSDGINSAAVRISSLAQLKNGTLFGYDHYAHKLYKRSGDKDALWVEVSLPGNLPDTAVFYLSRFNDILLLTDYTGAAGVWHSESEGVSWAQYDGLPQQRLLATAAPFDQVLLVGTDSLGVYSLSGNTFSPINNGLGTTTSVRGIAAKDNVYKNDLVRDYFYIATSTGLYRSQDAGENWERVFPGDFTVIY